MVRDFRGRHMQANLPGLYLGTDVLNNAQSVGEKEIHTFSANEKSRGM